MALLLLALPVGASGQIRATEYVSGLQQPVAFVQDPADAAIQYVVEQAGRVRLIHDGVLRPASFLDIAAIVQSGGERGLLGLAFAPDYATSRRFFVFYTDLNGDVVIARYQRSVSQPLTADPSSAKVLLHIVHSGPGFAGVHNGGSLVFGPDGFLYASIGEAGGSGHRAQDPHSFLGKILRLDVSVTDDDAQGYRVPVDNPFVDDDPIDALPEIWAFGLRNPWRIAFDDAPGGTGALLIGDVGENRREEVNYEPAAGGGRNYGWPNREGSLTFSTALPPAFEPLTDPIFEYDHNGGSGSITAGYVYRGSGLPGSLNGRFFFGDFILSRVWSVAIGGEGAASALREHTAELGGSGALAGVASFGRDAAGELYIVSYSGRVLKIVAGCGYQLTPSSRIVSSAGARLSVSLSTSAGCAWTVTGAPEWITVSPSSGVGAATLTVDIAASPSGAGRAATFTVQGTTFTVTQAPAARPNGDFDGDGRFDLLLRHEGDGSIGAWLMDGTTLKDGRLFSPGRVADTQWTTVGTGDFNGDAQPDLLWQHDDGALAAWFMNGTTQLEVVFLTPSAVPHRDWRVVGVADFNRDHHADLLLQHHTERTIAVWLMNGTALIDGRFVSPPRTADPGWDVVGTGDFNRDGHADIVLQHADGALGVWLMNGTMLIDGRLLSHALPDARWRVSAVGDLDGDGHVDLVLQHRDTRQLGAWLLRDLTLLDGRLLSPSSIADPAWRLVGPK